MFDYSLTILTPLVMGLWLSFISEPSSLPKSLGELLYFCLGILAGLGVMGCLHWLRTDRMLNLDRNPQSVSQQAATQINSVIEDDAFYILNQQWQFTAISAKAEELLERNAIDLLGNSIWDEFPDALGSMIGSMYRKAIAENLPVTFETYYAPLEGWFEVHAHPFEEGLSVYFKEISDRKRIETDLYKSQQILQSVMDTIPQSLFWKDRQSVFLGCNQNFAHGCSVNSPREVIGKTDYDFIWSREEADAFRAMDAQVMESDTPILHVIELFESIDHQQVWLDYSKFPLYDAEGTVVGMIGMYENITDRKHHEMLLQQTNEDLERRVAARTIELQQLVAQLEQEVLERQRTEAELRESKQMLELVFDTLPQRIFWKDRQLNYLGCNKLFAQDAGLASPEQIIGKNDFELSWKELAHLYRADDAAIIESNIPRLNFEEPYTSEDGASAWVITSKIPMTNERGEVFGVFGSLEDISDRKRAEAALEASERKYRILVETSQDLIWSIDLEGRYTFINPAAQHIFGYEPHEMIGRAFSDFQTSDCIQRDQQVFEQVLAGQSVKQYETAYLSKAGRTVYLAFNAIALQDEGGNIIGATGTASDITQRKQVELELQKTRIFLESVLKHLPVGVIAKDARDLRYVLWNTGAEKVLGRSAREILGKTDSEIYPTQQAEIFLAQDYQVLESGQMLDVEEATTIANGEERIFHSQKTLIVDVDGNPEYLLLLTEDITDRKHAVDALRQSEERFQRVVANVPGMIYQFRLAPNGQVSFPYVSSFCRELYGIEAAELQDNAYLILDRIHPDEREGFEASVRRSAATLKSWEWTGRSLHRANGYRWIKGISRPERQPDGAIVWDGLVVDITDRKQVEDELRNSQQLLQLVMDTIPQLIAWKDRNSFYVGCNKNMAKVSGVETPQNIVGKTDYDLAHALGWEKNIADFYRDCDAQVMDSGVPRRHVVEPQLQADGKSVWLDTSKLPLYDAEGEVVGVLLMFEDITERMKIEQDLRLYKRAVECSGDAIGIADASGTHIYHNPAFSKLLDCETPDQLRQAGGIPNIFADPSVAEMVVQATMKEQQWVGEVEVRSLSGRSLPALLRANVIVDEAGQLIGTVGSMMDISDRKQAEMQLRQQAHDLETTLRKLQNTQTHLIQSEKMSALGQLVAGVAHEINNPVGFISGNLSHAIEYTQDLLNLVHLYQIHYPNPVAEIQDEIAAIELPFLVEDLPKLVGSMRVGADRIQGIVASLRTFSRMDESDMKSVNIHDGIDSTLMILQSRLKPSPTRPAIEIIKTYGTLPMVECYAGQLNQVFMNLLTNAIDALEEMMVNREAISRQACPDQDLEGFIPTIHIQTELIQTELPDSPKICIRIADNGMGMTEKVCNRLFDPFFTTKPVGKGTGMGLSISYQIVTERHGGTLQCVSTPGQGAEFKIEIPARQV
ncbi:MAG: PAS domain-containing protein [Drouetiella hepatica Uher 2000/2452]|jgi:PAS domain S-box-containing protein|uniref:histidine kinase n=1 Tax=Drouetiella hepatica Uher 2000/2452 TaxID=904376 RepID=A0A951QE18_9CYAN|nr:PAS domain-containing protein [Drouetiella hepatica Uher 2000/2452]